MILPSKELLSEVLGKKLYLEHLWYIKENELLYYTEDNGGGEHINIYELQYKMKEWAIKQEYVIIEYPLVVEVYKDGSDYVEESFNDLLTVTYSPYRVFNACEWIYNEVNK